MMRAEPIRSLTVTTPVPVRCALAVLLAAIVTTAAAQEQWEIYVCTESEEAGYRLQGDTLARNRYEGATFTFSLSATDPVGTLEEHGAGGMLYMDCLIPYEDKAPTTISCTEGAHTFVMDLESGRFAFSRLFGYVFPDPITGGPNGDAVTVGVGLCKPSQGI